MSKYYLTNKAVEDLAEIWNYTYDEWSEKQADKYYNFLLDSCKEIAAKPNKGKSYNFIRNGLLGFKSNQHIIFFHILSKNEIEIIRILHGKMDLNNKIY